MPARERLALGAAALALVVVLPVLNALPILPAGWTGSGTSYKYSSDSAGLFRICASGDGTVAATPNGTSCP